MKQILIVLIFLCSAGLYALDESQVNLIAETTMNVPGFNLYFANVESDGSLVFYDAVTNNTSITIRKVICSQEGVVSDIQTVMTYTSSLTWSGLPSFVKLVQNDLFTYLYFRNSQQIVIFKIPDNALDVFPSVHVFENHGADAFHSLCEQLDNISYYITSTGIYSLNLSNDTQNLVRSCPDGTNWVQMVSLGGDYILIFSQVTEDFQLIIDAAGNITEPVFNNTQFITHLAFIEPDIGGGIYFCHWMEGVTSSTYGFIEYNNNELRFASLSSAPVTTQKSNISLGNQRFICNEHHLSDSYYQTYYFVNYQLVADTDFPYIVPTDYPNVQRLFKTSDRYIVGVSSPSDTLRCFVCIDLQDQTIFSTIDTLQINTHDDLYDVYYGANNIYYVYQNNIKIYAVESATGISDNTQTPVAISATSYPNPFRGSTEIVVKDDSSKATTFIYNIKGQLVRKLNSSENTATDMHFTWDGKDQQGKSTPAGIYLYRVDGNHKISGKMVKME